jgi:alpha-beta hydrolase superfamily lysophospholipase
MKVEFTYMSKDGRTPIHAVRWIPESGRCRAILQIVHGMTEFIERYAPFAEYLAAHDFLVVGHDLIGHGQSVLTREDWGYIAPGNGAKILIQDIHQLRLNIQRANKGVPYFMLGHSMGSFLVRRYISSRAKGLDGVIIMGTGFTDPLVARSGILLADLLAKVYGWHHRSSFLTGIALGSNGRFDSTGKHPEKSWLTRDAEIAAWYYRQPACTYTFTLNGYRALFDTVKKCCMQENADRIPKKLPMMIVSGADDPIGGFGAGVRKTEELYRRAGLKDLKTVLYENDRHEILNELDRDKVFADLLDWMEAHMDHS